MRKIYKAMIFVVFIALIIGICKKDDLKIQMNKIYTNHVLKDNKKYCNALDFTLYGSLTEGYRRFKDIEGIESFCRTSTGLSIAFRTNSPEIILKWENKNVARFANMSLLNKAGIDVYEYEYANGGFTYVASALPSNESYTYKKVLTNMDGSQKVFLLNLPTYSEINKIEIGIDENSTIEKYDILSREKIIVYGSSITQGASSSRPGLNYPNLISRNLKREVINVGFSGLGIFDLKLLPFLEGIDAKQIILESIPNATTENVKDYGYQFVESLLNNGKAIYLVEGFIREDSRLNNDSLDVRSKISTESRNRVLFDIYNRFKQSGHNIHWVDNTCFDSIKDFTVDGIHLNDRGHEIQANHILKYFE